MPLCGLRLLPQRAFDAERLVCSSTDTRSSTKRLPIVGRSAPLPRTCFVYSCNMLSHAFSRLQPIHTLRLSLCSSVKMLQTKRLLSISCERSQRKSSPSAKIMVSESTLLRKRVSFIHVFTLVPLQRLLAADLLPTFTSVECVVPDMLSSFKLTDLPSSSKILSMPVAT